MTTKPGWLRRRAEKEARKLLALMDASDYQIELQTAAIENVARAFAERTLQKAQGETIAVSIFEAEAIARADEE